MNSTIDSKIEVTRMLYIFAQQVRCNKRRPEFATEAADREVQFKRELEQLEREKEKAALEQRELPIHQAA